MAYSTRKGALVGKMKMIKFNEHGNLGNNNIPVLNFEFWQRYQTLGEVGTSVPKEPKYNNKKLNVSK